MMTSTDNARTFLIADISDTYKERHGIRPRFFNWAAMSMADLQAALDRLLPSEDDLEAERLEMEAEERRWAEYEARCEAQDEADRLAAIQAKADSAEDALWALQDSLEGF